MNSLQVFGLVKLVVSFLQEFIFCGNTLELVLSFLPVRLCIVELLHQLLLVIIKLVAHFANQLLLTLQFLLQQLILLLAHADFRLENLLLIAQFQLLLLFQFLLQLIKTLLLLA